MSENNSNSILGFLTFLVFVVWVYTCWGEPDIVDAFIYWLSDGHYKPQLYTWAGLLPLDGDTGNVGSAKSVLEFC